MRLLEDDVEAGFFSPKDNGKSQKLQPAITKVSKNPENVLINTIKPAISLLLYAKIVINKTKRCQLAQENG